MQIAPLPITLGQNTHCHTDCVGPDDIVCITPHNFPLWTCHPYTDFGYGEFEVVCLDIFFHILDTHSLEIPLSPSSTYSLLYPHLLFSLVVHDSGYSRCFNTILTKVNIVQNTIQFKENLEHQPSTIYTYTRHHSSFC